MNNNIRETLQQLQAAWEESERLIASKADIELIEANLDKFRPLMAAAEKFKKENPSYEEVLSEFPGHFLRENSRESRNRVKFSFPEKKKEKDENIFPSAIEISNWDHIQRS